jgi:hypothetical protein
MINCRMQRIFNYKQRQLVCGGYNYLSPNPIRIAEPKVL